MRVTIAAMWMWRAAVAGLTLVSLADAPAAARGDAPRACRFPGEPALTGAQQERLETLSAEINSLAPHADCRPLAARLGQLLDEPCFRVLKHVSPLPACGSGLALRDWWREGGRAWVQSADADRPRGRIVVFPPGMRPVLDLASGVAHPLAALLCPPGDAACGRETGGWLKRVEDAMARRQLTGRDARLGDACKKISGASPPERYAGWRDCVEQQRRRRMFRAPLPASAFRAPAQGWLVVRGRRGHYTFSDELAAFDLETGAAFRAIRRGDLGILEPEDAEAIERRRTGRRKVVVERGHVPIENLREAALAVFLDGERRPQLFGVEVALPAGVDVVPLPTTFAFSQSPHVIVQNSGDTWLSWEWLQGGKVIASGTIKYTGLTSRDAEDPTWLLEIAEAGLQPACPPARLPPGLLGRGRPLGGVSPIDATRADLDDSEEALARALTAPDPSCPR